MIARRRYRQGISLMEVLVVISILLALMVVAAPAIGSILKLEQRRSAKRVAMLYERLHDEAVLRNHTFRIQFNLASNEYKVEVGEARAVIYSTPEQRDRYEEETTRKLALMDEEERRQHEASRKPFERLNAHFKSEFKLPKGLEIGGIYTPQYGKMMTLDELPDDPEDGPPVVESYVFASGFTEHTVIWLTEEGEPDEGWTIVVEPLSGRVHLHGELVDWEDTIDEIPDEGPSLPS